MNEAGVVGGNTAIFTRALWHGAERKSLGLTGMDSFRLGLEGGRNAEDVVDIIVELLERYGQWGSAVQGKNHEQGSYENAFIFADQKEGWVLETSGCHWVAERLVNGVRAISNELTIRNRWTKGIQTSRSLHMTWAGGMAVTTHLTLLSSTAIMNTTHDKFHTLGG